MYTDAVETCAGRVSTLQLITTWYLYMVQLRININLAQEPIYRQHSKGGSYKLDWKHMPCVCVCVWTYQRVSGIS